MPGGNADLQNADEQNADEQNADQSGNSNVVVVTPKGTMPSVTCPITGVFASGVTLLNLKVGDYGEYIRIQVSDLNGNVDLSGASLVTLRMAILGCVPETLNASVTSTTNNGIRNEIGYKLTSSDTLFTGTYSVEAEAEWTDGRMRTSNRLVIIIEDDIG